MCFAPWWRTLFRHLNFQKWSEVGVFCTFWLENASCHNGCAFLNISTSKSALGPSVFNTFDLETRFAPQRRALFRHRNFQKWSVPALICTFWLGNVLRAITAYTFSTSQPPKEARTGQFFTLLTWKCASRHRGVHFFDIATSKSGPYLLWFCAFWLGHVLRASTAYTFSTSQLPKVVRGWCVLHILTWKCFVPQRRALFWTSQLPRVLWDRQFLTLLTWKRASRHNGVRFFDISTSKSAPKLRWFGHFDFETSCLRTRRFSEPTFRPSGATNHWKNAVNRDFLTFWRTCFFFLLTLSPLWSSHCFSSPLWLFPYLLLPSVHIVGSLTSKLPSIIYSPPLAQAVLGVFCQDNQIEFLWVFGI